MTRLLLPFYVIPLCYYFIKLIFVLSVIFALFLVFCSTTSAFRIPEYSFLKAQLLPQNSLLDFVKENEGLAHIHYTNTWVSYIEGNPYKVQKITEKYGYVILDEVRMYLESFYFTFYSSLRGEYVPNVVGGGSMITILLLTSRGEFVEENT